MGEGEGEGFEQFCLWQLLSAEGPDCHLVIPALASLSTEGEGVRMRV